MKLKPRQVIGLVAIVVFGGMMAFRLTQPSEREIMERRLASLPSIQVPPPTYDLAPTLPPATLDLSIAGATTAGSTYEPPAEPDYLNLGSQAAKDDLYCGGVLSARFNAEISTAHPDAMSLLLRDSQALDTAGVEKLKAEGLATEANWAGFTLAYDAKTKVDYTAKTLRISPEACTQRAAALN
jgi:hypothetical protein